MTAWRGAKRFKSATNTETTKMNNHALITIDRNELNAIDTLDRVNEHINAKLKQYDVPVTINWRAGLGFSKMATEAFDAAGFTKDKKERTAMFKRIQAIFINEGLNDLIEAAMRKFGYQPRFGGSTKAGVVSMKFVPEHKLHGEKADPVAKVANAMVDEQAKVLRIQAAEQRALENGQRAAKLAQVLKDKFGVVDIDAEVTSIESVE
jgi:hypothetical protein